MQLEICQCVVGPQALHHSKAAQRAFSQLGSRRISACLGRSLRCMPVRRNCCLLCAVQVSEKILLLDAEAKELRLAAAAADDRAEVLAREKMQVMGLAEELRADVAAKMTLLDEFEARFARQYRYACSCNITLSVA